MRFWRTPFDIDKMKIPHGELHIINDRCKGCEFCVQYCPRDVLAMSKEFNVKGYHYPEAVSPEKCVNCDLCEMICPEFAIYCIESEEVQTRAVHETSAVTKEQNNKE